MSGWRPDLVEVKPSALHGLGVFAATDVAAGTRWWSLTIDETITISRAQFDLLVGSAAAPASAGILAGIYTYSLYLRSLDRLIFIPDNGRFVNHGDSPNSECYVEGGLLYSVALRDIAVGEEILEDYGTYDVCPWPTIPAEFNEAPATQPVLAAALA